MKSVKKDAFKIFAFMFPKPCVNIKVCRNFLAKTESLGGSGLPPSLGGLKLCIPCTKMFRVKLKCLEKKDECAVCREDDCRLIELPICKHALCCDCTRSILLENNSSSGAKCPLCRRTEFNEHEQMVTSALKRLRTVEALAEQSETKRIKPAARPNHADRSSHHGRSE